MSGTNPRRGEPPVRRAPGIVELLAAASAAAAVSTPPKEPAEPLRDEDAGTCPEVRVGPPAAA